MLLRLWIPEAIEPLDRGERFERPLIRLIDPVGGDIVESGTFMKDANLVSALIEFEVPDLAPLFDAVVRILIEGHAVQGTTLSRIDGDASEVVLFVV